MSPPGESGFAEAGVTLISIHDDTARSIALSKCSLAVVQIGQAVVCHAAMIIDNIVRVYETHNVIHAYDLEGRHLQTQIHDETNYADVGPKMLAYRTWHNAWRVLDPKVAALLNPIDDKVEALA